MNNFAPVLICTLNRYQHFKNCIESLLACSSCSDTDLFIGFDFPSQDDHWDGYEKIKAYLPTIKGFKSINITYREKNFGVNINWSSMIDYIFLQYDRLIISEDDNIFNRSFLDFVNQGLDLYNNRDDVFSISGYNYPFKFPSFYKHDSYLVTAFSGWGVGVWRDKYNKVEWSLDYFDILFNKENNHKTLKTNYELWYSNLQEIRDKRILKGDGVLLMHMIENKMYSLFPISTKVKNMGHDNSGVNCGYNELYLNQSFNKEYTHTGLLEQLQPDPRILIFFSKQLRQPLIEKVKSFIPRYIKLFLKNLFAVFN
jgi:hypothetical protein